MKATFISDEFSQDVEECLLFATESAGRTIELRSLGGLSVTDMDDVQLRNLSTRLQSERIDVVGLDTFCFKHECEHPQIDASLAKLDRSADVAISVGAPWLRIFAFWNDRTLDVERIASAVAAACDIVRDRNVTLLVENGTFSAVGEGSKLAALLDLLAGYPVAALWDPANLFNGGWPESSDAGLAALGTRVAHVHVKSPVWGQPGNMRYGPLVNGMIDWQRHLLQLDQQGFAGFLSLETHWRIDRDLHGRDQLDFPEGVEFSAGAASATRQSMNELLGLMDNARRLSIGWREGVVR